MRKSFFSFFAGLLALIFILILGISGCGGGNGTSVGTASTVTVTPASLSLDFGQVAQLSTTVKDAGGNTILTLTPTYSSSSSSVTVSTGGLVCAGTWDSLTIPVVCTPAISVGAATITATAGGVTSTAVTVTLHPHIARLTLTTTAPAAGCSSQTKTQQFTGHAFDSNNVDITSQVGAFTYSSSNTAAVTIDAATGIATAVQPGSSNISAIINNVFSLPATFTVCPPASISLAPAAPLTLAAAATQQLTPIVIDTQGATLTGVSLTYSSSQPASVTVSSGGLVTAVAAGNAGIVASCTPPACNGGTSANVPVYSNLISATVSGTSSSTVYVTGANSTTVVPIDTTTNVAGTAITIPQISSIQPVINSFVFNSSGTKAYLGNDRNLLIFDVATSAFSSPTVTLAGRVLAVSPDGKKVVIADQTASAPKTYVFDTTNNSFDSLTATITTVTTAADFSADSLKAYLVSGGSLWAYSPGTAPPLVQQLAVSATVNDAKFLTQGSLGYLAGGVGNSITSHATCDNSLVSTLAVPKTPLRISSNFDSTRVFAVDDTNIDDVTVSNIGTAPNTNCPATVTNSVNTVSFNQASAFSPAQVIVTSDGTRVFVNTKLNKLLVYNATSSTTSSIALTGGGTSTTAGATLDSKQLYIGASTNDVHRIDVAAGTDAQQIAVSLKNSGGTAVSPDFVVVRPK